MYTIQFKKENEKIVAELTNIDNNQVIRLSRKKAKPATLIDFRMQCFAENDQGEEVELGEKISNQIFNAIKARRNQQKSFIA